MRFICVKGFFSIFRRLYFYDCFDNVYVREKNQFKGDNFYDNYSSIYFYFIDLGVNI